MNHDIVRSVLADANSCRRELTTEEAQIICRAYAPHDTTLHAFATTGVLPLDTRNLWWDAFGQTYQQSSSLVREALDFVGTFLLA